jgi:hypothetical protein
MAMCRVRPNPDCDLAALRNVEVVLLDIESKYTRAIRSSTSAKDHEEFDKIKNAASEARQKVSDLEDLMK